MSMVLEESVAEVLRGDRSQRPVADHDIAAVVRTRLDDHFRASMPPNTHRRITAADFRRTVGTPVDAAPAVRLRGALLTQLLALLSVGYSPVHPFTEAVDAWRAGSDYPDLLAYAHSLTGDDLARLATDVDAHGVTLVRRLGPISPRWYPRVNVRTTLSFADGRVTVADTIDLAVGSPASERASVALLDITSSPLSDVHTRIMQFHALCETVRSGVAPLRVVALSTATGEISAADVDRDLLVCAADDLVTIADGVQP